MIFRTSPQADDDIAYAYVESAARFGVGQAERYQDGLFAAFQILADNPLMARERRELRPPVRLHPYRAHMIVYVEDGPSILIVRVLSGGSSESLNVKGAYFEVLSDMLGSLGVIVAALIVMFTGWRLADPIVGAGIGLFIVPRTWSLLSQVTHILLEGTPPQVDVALLERRLAEIPGVAAVHDLHVWTITSGLDAMSGHLVVSEMSEAAQVLRQARQMLAEEFKVDHVTIQVEDPALRAEEKTLHV